MGDELRMLSRLNEETKVFHAEADTEIERYLLHEPVTASAYRAFLTRLYGFLVPFEAALADTPGLVGLIDVRARSCASLVVRDLFALGVSGTFVASLPHCECIPGFRGPAQALGWMYVVERPLLANGVIKRHLSGPLAPEMACASAYLSNQTGTIGRSWRELGTLMDRIAETPAIGDRMVQSAREAFRAQRRWRTVEQVETQPQSRAS